MPSSGQVNIPKMYTFTHFIERLRYAGLYARNWGSTGKQQGRNPAHEELTIRRRNERLSKYYIVTSCNCEKGHRGKIPCRVSISQGDFAQTGRW